MVDEKFHFSHIWVYDIEKEEATRLTEGEFIVSDAHWSVDSKQIVYVSRPNTKNDERWKTDIWVVDLGTKTPRKLYENPGPDSSL